MNSTLEASLRLADGCYFTDAELQPLEGFFKTYTVRLQTYCILQEKADSLVEATLEALAKTDWETVQQHGDKCKRDMNYVVRSIAIAILRDDTEAFSQQLVLWMQNIMAALRKEAQSARAYKLLQQVVQEQIPVDNAKLINDHLDLFVTALNSIA